MEHCNLGSLALDNNSHFMSSAADERSKSQLAARRPPVRREIGQRSKEHLVLIGLCLWMVFILVCHIMSLSPSLPPSSLAFFFFPFSGFTSLAGMHIWSLSSPKSGLVVFFFFFAG